MGNLYLATAVTHTCCCVFASTGGWDIGILYNSKKKRHPAVKRPEPTHSETSMPGQPRLIAPKDRISRGDTYRGPKVQTVWVGPPTPTPAAGSQAVALYYLYLFLSYYLYLFPLCHMYLFPLPLCSGCVSRNGYPIFYMYIYTIRSFARPTGMGEHTSKQPPPPKPHK
jgi:hypothetical protein